MNTEIRTSHGTCKAPSCNTPAANRVPFANVGMSHSHASQPLHPKMPPSGFQPTRTRRRPLPLFSFVLRRNIILYKKVCILQSCRQLKQAPQILKINTLILITSSLILFSCTYSSKDLNCKDFKNGVFHSTLSQNGASNSISRNDSMQREYNLTTGAIVLAKIKWINDCEYELTYIDEKSSNQDTIHGFIKPQIFTNKILKTVAGEINGTRYNYCVFESSLFGVSQKLTDTLWKHDTTD